MQTPLEPSRHRLPEPVVHRGPRALTAPSTWMDVTGSSRDRRALDHAVLVQALSVENSWPNSWSKVILTIWSDDTHC